MPDYETLYPGRFLKKEILAAPKVIRILGITTTDLEGDKGMEQKVTLKYRAADGEGEAVWCKTNCVLLREVLGTRDYEKWIGHLVTIAHDPRVSFGPKKVGGVRVYGSPEMKKAIKVEIKPPRRKTARPEDIYDLIPTDNNGKPRVAKSSAPKDEPPPITDDDMLTTEDLNDQPPAGL